MSKKIVENSAKAIIVDSDRVLLIRYQDSSELNLGTWYALPGGRQQYGESLSEAVQRECQEEIGATVTVDRLLFVREYIHARHRFKDLGRDQHKVEFMFQCQLESDVGQGRKTDNDQSAVVWVELDELDSLTIFPTDLKNLRSYLNNNDRSVYWGSTF